MGEEQQEPAWLVRLRRQPPQPEAEQPPVVEGRPAPADQAGTAEDQQGPAWLADLREQQQQEPPRAAEDLRIPLGQADMVEGLREQMIQTQGTLEYEEKPSLIRVFSSLRPAQRLILAIFLFLDVALCGCMALAMAGRVMLPF